MEEQTPFRTMKDLYEIEKQSIVDLIALRTKAEVHPLRFELDESDIEFEFKLEDRSGIYPNNHVHIKSNGSVSATFCEKWKSKEAEVAYFLGEELDK